MSLDPSVLTAMCDCVVMLTWSDWKTEPRSNRYHWSTRLARHLPVLFVQPDRLAGGVSMEPSGSSNITLVHASPLYDAEQCRTLARVINGNGFRRPLLWIYNTHFVRFVRCCYSPLKVYHATEDYFLPGAATSPEIQEDLRSTLQHVDLVIAVSEAVQKSYVKFGGYTGGSLVLPNGCDYIFWTAENAGERPTPVSSPGPVVFYQGGINTRLDFGLLHELVHRLPDWEFAFCGQVEPGLKEWDNLKTHPNVTYHGVLEPERIRELAKRASVGLIPFLQNPLMEASLPLKAFEYVACGLPVVSIPIRALTKHPHVFSIANDVEGFAAAIRSAAQTRLDAAALAERHRVAHRYDYDARFEEFLEWLAGVKSGARDTGCRLNIAVLYDPGSTHVATLLEHLTSLSTFSRHEVYFLPATKAANPHVDLSLFDVAVIHYSVRVSLEDHLSPHFADALIAFSGLKVLFVQDEYDTTETTRNWIERLGIQMVFTCVPQDQLDIVYPHKRFPYVEFVPTLTGYVPLAVRRIPRPLSDRTLFIAYRGRALPFWYGELGQEKMLIGKQMREICEARGIPVDIEWDDRKRIYGSGWYDFLQSARATLGTESGSNVLDEHGEIRAAVEDALLQNPALTYAEAYRRFLVGHEGRVCMNQISPKIFEAIACRTALVLFEGRYSDVLKPDLHFIPLKKDFSNVDDVLTKLADDDFLEGLTARAFDEVIASGRYSYRRFVDEFDALLATRSRQGCDIVLLSTLTAVRAHANDSQLYPVSELSDVTLLPTSVPLRFGDRVRTPPRAMPLRSLAPTLQRMWRLLPPTVRKRMAPVSARVRRALTG